jgi:hypothetical protein
VILTLAVGATMMAKPWQGLARRDRRAVAAPAGQFAESAVAD